MIRFVLLLCAALLAGCRERPECDQDTPCPFGASCEEGLCVSARCATGAQCGMEQRCDDGRCVYGCGGDEDCYPGDACDLERAQCAPAACTDAHRDCAFQEFCNAASGECYEAAGYWCRGCTTDEACGETGENHCINNYCMVGCTNDSDCPAGFYCYGFVDNEGNPQFYVCFSDCEIYETWFGRPAPPPPPGERTLVVDPEGRTAARRP